MTRKNATAWSTNTDKTNGVTYSSATTTYNSSTTAYSASTVTLDTFDKLPSSWTKTNKVANSWQPNPAASTSEYAYDSATDTYDSAIQTYDGIVSGQDYLNTSTPTAWAELAAS